MSDDRLNQYHNEHELKFAREQGFFDKSVSLRTIIVVLFGLALVAFLHFREERIDVLELDSIAPSYIVAQVDFDFLDREATAILKEEAVRDIGKIYAVAEKEVRSRRLEFDNFLNEQKWREQLPQTTSEEIYQAGDLVERRLQQLRFTDPRTKRTLKLTGLPVENYLIFTPANSDRAVVLSSAVWEAVQQKIMNEHLLPQETVDFAISYFESKAWHLEEDLTAVSQLRREVQKRVKDKYTHITAGTPIIDQGEVVTTRHLAMLQAMKHALNESRNLWHPMTILGSVLLALLFMIVSTAYFYHHHPQVLASNRQLFLLIAVLLVAMGLAKATEFVLLNSKNNLIEAVRYPIIVPFAAIIVCSLMNFSIATYAAGFLAVIFTLTLAFGQSGFMLLNLAAALVAILSARSLRRRKEIFIVCGKAWLACVGVLLALHLYQNTVIGTAFLSDILSTGICMLLTGVLVVGLMPLLESGFRIMTDVSLMEYMDPNSDLLRRLSVEAPGTYQHSVLVGNLAEAAALAVGANGLFCRVASLYHDIGKMATPQYFTENQQGGINIHQLLTPRESADVIIAHVSEGVAMGRKEGLPEPIIDVIKEHHGTQLVFYFYNKECMACAGGADEVDEHAFRYAGPKPRSKESVIIMFADSLEAASRSLDEVTEETLTALANRLIKEKVDDGQLDECLLTFEELARVKASLVTNLVASGHARIKYPARTIKGAEEA
jgi:putative nucleotidyltransferase with HDIG domain